MSGYPPKHAPLAVMPRRLHDRVGIISSAMRGR